MKGKFVKTYAVSNLCDSRETIGRRVELINEIGASKLRSVPTVHAEFSEEQIVVAQNLITPTDAQRLGEVDLKNLASDLEFMSELGFIHGDLNRRNICATQTGFVILDFEPSLKQRVNNRIQTKVTIPYLANRDRAENTVSSLTDKLGFFYFIRRVTGSFGPRDIVELSRSRDHSNYLGFDEGDLEYKSFRELVALGLSKSSQTKVSRT